MVKDFLQFIGEGFTVDDDIVATYVRIFTEGQFNKEYTDDDEMFREIDMWNSLSKTEQEYVFKQSKFTGFVDTSGDNLIICRIASLEYLLGSAWECIENRLYYDGVEDEDTHIIISYSKALPGPDGEQYKTFDVGDTDIESNPFIRTGKNVKFKNRIITQNIEWVFDMMYDCVYLKSDNAARSLVNYTGFEYYKNGKKIM